MITSLHNNFSNIFRKTTSSLGLLIAMTLGFFTNNNLQAQVATGYQFSQDVPAAYVPITGGTVYGTGTFDDVTGPTNPVAVSAAIGFTFNYNGTNYTNCFVSRGGFITFDDGLPSIITPTTPFGNPISTGTYDGVISGFSTPRGLWSADKLPVYGASFPSEIRYETSSGPVGSRVFTVQYQNMIRKTATATLTGLLNFQIRIYETSNKIEIIHNVVNPIAPNAVNIVPLATNAQIGIKGKLAADFNIRNGGWNSTSANTTTSTTGITLGPAVNNYPATVTRFTYKPCYQVTALTATPSTPITNYNITWTAPAIGDGTPITYDYELRTSGAFNSGASGLITSGNTAATTFPALGLTFGTTYTFYVRTSPNCGGTPVSVAFTPACVAQAIPYSQNFETTIVPALPLCHLTVNSSGTPFVTAFTSPVLPPLSAGGFTGNYATATADKDSWYFTEGITVPAGNYKLTYKYGGDRSQNFFVQKMRVFIGTGQGTVFGSNNMTGGILLDTHPTIKSSPNFGDVTFNVATTGTYYIGFQGYNVAGSGALHIDDILLEPAVCLPVNNIIAQNITYSSVDLSWTDSSTVDGGYLVFVSSTGATPANDDYVGTYYSSTPNLSINGLSGLTTYCVWVRTICDGGGAYGGWTKMTTGSGCFTTPAAPPSWCIPTPPSASALSFFSNFTTSGGASNINNNSGFSSGGYGNFTSQVVSQSPGNAVNFTATIPTGGHSIAIWIDWNNDGDFADTTPNEVMFTANQLSNAPIPSGSFTVPVGQAVGNYRMRIFMDFFGGIPTNPCAFTATGPRGEVEDYTFKVIVPPPALTLSATGSTQCGNVTTGLVTLTTPLSNFGNNTNYSMSPAAGVTGNATSGYTFTNPVSQVYTLTGTQTVSPFSVNTVRYTYTANSTPTPITITPSTMAVCANGPAKLLTASGGLVNGVVIYNEDFNSGAPGWTQVNSSTAGSNSPSCSTWTIRNSGTYTACNGNAYTVTSNDNSAYYTSNTDSQGLGGQNNNVLTSPAFSLVGYTSATLNFYQHLRMFCTTAKVEISTDGSTWTTLELWQTPVCSATINNGTNLIFESKTYNLTPYVGNATVSIRYNYVDVFGWFWSIDNFKVTGSTANSTTWSPITELYTDANATIAYTGQITNTVYALPTVARTYTATAVTPAPVCSSSKSINVVITPIVKPIITAGDNQLTCTGLQASVGPMTVAGLAAGNSVARWEWSDTPTFTVATPCSLSANSLSLATFKMALPITQDRYYRAVIVNGSCTIYSDPIKLTFSKTSTTDGVTWTNGLPTSAKAVVFDGPGTYTVPGNINACSVTVLNGAVVTITSTLTVENGLNTSGGTLKFANDSSLMQTSTAANTSPITYVRESTPMRVFDYTHWSSPVAGQVLNLFSPFTRFDKFHIWDTTLTNPYWTNVLGSTTMDVGRGYIIRSQLSPGTPGFTTHTNPFVGIPNNGSYTTNVQISGVGGINNYNLIGNPYPSGLNADLFLTANSLKISGTIYIWTHNTPLTNNQYNHNNDFASYNLSGGIGAGSPSTVAGVSQNKVPNGVIASGQAFFVEVLPSVQSGSTLTTSSVSFTNGMRTGALNNVFFRNSNQNNNPQITTSTLEKNRIRLDMTNVQGAFSEMLYGNIETATNGFDQLFDGKLSDDTTTASLYSMLGNERLSIKGNALPFNVNDTNNVGYKANVAGNFQIKLANFDGLFVNENIYLEDKLLNVIHDLKQSDYDFTTNVGTFNDRFVLRFTNSSLTNTKTVFNENTVFIYKKNSDIHINTSNIEMKAIAVYDVNGRTIYENNKVSGSEFVINNLNASQQVLIVKVTATDGKIVNKKIVF